MILGHLLFRWTVIIPEKPIIDRVVHLGASTLKKNIKIYCMRGLQQLLHHPNQPLQSLYSESLNPFILTIGVIESLPWTPCSPSKNAGHSTGWHFHELIVISTINSVNTAHQQRITLAFNYMPFHRLGRLPNWMLMVVIFRSFSSMCSWQAHIWGNSVNDVQLVSWNRNMSFWILMAT